MTFEKKKEPAKCSTYHGLNREYPCICEAQSFQQMEAFALAHGMDFVEMVRSDWTKLYKTYPIDGGCWLIQNPALVTLQMAAGRNIVKRKAPSLLKSDAALKAQLKEAEAPKKAEREAFPDPDDYQFNLAGNI